MKKTKNGTNELVMAGVVAEDAITAAKVSKYQSYQKSPFSNREKSRKYQLIQNKKYQKYQRIQNDLKRAKRGFRETVRRAGLFVFSVLPSIWFDLNFAETMIHTASEHAHFLSFDFFNQEKNN